MDVVVIVTRWYGGVNLGPDRFRCMGRTKALVIHKQYLMYHMSKYHDTGITGCAKVLLDRLKDDESFLPLPPLTFVDISNRIVNGDKNVQQKAQRHGRFI